MRNPVNRSERSLPLLVAIVFGLACGSADAPSEPSAGPAGGVSPGDVRRADAPNLLLITLDTTRADALGAYGQPRETTPNLDRLVLRGVLFEDVTASQPETLPSHSTIFTGKLPYAHGVRSNSGYVLPESNLTLAEVLLSNGYRTGAEIAAPVLRSSTQVTQGFEHQRGTDDPDAKLKVIHYRDELGERRERTRAMRTGADIAQRGIEFIAADTERPFFLWLHFFDPHDPYSAPPAFNEKIPDSPYHAEVAYTDFQIGLVLRELDRLGLRDRTLVVVTADHGEGLFEHGEPSHSYFLYDTVVRVPLILAGMPALPAGLRISPPVRTADIAPTVLELLGLPPFIDVQGVSLMPLVQGTASDLALTGYGEATRFTATFGLPPIRFVRRGPWKYIHKVNPELYDVVDDPGELENLADRHRERVAGLQAELRRMLDERPAAIDDAQTTVDASTAAQLVALGYVAHGPTFEVDDEARALELFGDDPAEKQADIQAVSKASGFLGRQDFAAALDALEPLLVRNPGNPFAMDLVAQALAGRGRYGEAVALLREVVAQKPADLEARYRLASALTGQGSSEEAAAVLQALLEQEPCDERFRLEQAQLLRTLRRHGELVALLAEGSERCPDVLSNWNNYAWVLATLPEDALRDGARAVRIMEESIRRLPEPSPAFTDTLAAAHAEAGDFEAAIRFGTQVIEEARAANDPPEVVAQLEQHLESYRAGRPIRDPSAAP
jgi:arylsulfatase A-like enzyme/Flp pilus assembly protein TadD